jgi:hypothetical protein
VDFSLFKNFNFTERVRLQFRSEFFNLFNTPQFGRPNAALLTGGGYLPVAGTGGSVTYPNQALQGRTGPGQITSLVAPMRQIQLGLKLIF